MFAWGAGKLRYRVSKSATGMHAYRHCERDIVAPEMTKLILSRALKQLHAHLKVHRWPSRCHTWAQPCCACGALPLLGLMLPQPLRLQSPPHPCCQPCQLTPAVFWQSLALPCCWLCLEQAVEPKSSNEQISSAQAYHTQQQQQQQDEVCMELVLEWRSEIAS